MGRVTLYMSMVLIMMAGVVRKKKRKKRKVLIAIKRAHQVKRRMDRCFLGRGREGGVYLVPWIPALRGPHAVSWIWRALGLIPMESLWGSKVEREGPALLASSVSEEFRGRQGAGGGRATEAAYQIMSLGCGA
jgi:hypothetical protein